MAICCPSGHLPDAMTGWLSREESPEACVPRRGSGTLSPMRPKSLLDCLEVREGDELFPREGRHESFKVSSSIVACS